jgi:hypothetical protein
VNWLDKARAAARRYQDPGLSALLVAQVILIFIAEPLAFEGFEAPLIAIGVIVVGLVLLLVLGSPHHGALVVVGVAGATRGLTLVADFVWGAPLIEAEEAIIAILGLLAVMWVITEIVFGPGRVTAHRVRGAILLYLSIAVVFAWLYRLIAEAAPSGFSGLKFHGGPAWRPEPLSLLQPDVADDAWTGRHHAGQCVRAEPDRARGAAGADLPAVVLARVLTLYTDDKDRQDARSEQPPLSEKGA